MSIEQKELTVLKGQISKLENQANAFTITTAEEYAASADLIAKLKEAGSAIKTKKESITKPLTEALNNARDLFKPIEQQFANAESIIKAKILTYKRKIDEEARAKEAKIAADLESGKIKKMETAERKMEAVARVAPTTRGSVGEIQVRKVKKVRIVNESLIPREYLEPNMVAIRRDALGGKQIAGVEVYDEETVAAGRF